MKFSELDTAAQESIIDLLNNHIASSADILKQDRCLIPMLMIPDSHQLVSLQSRDGSVDVDKAYAAVVGKLKNEAFTYALFSYSTRIGLAAGGETDALKTYIFTQNGQYLKIKYIVSEYDSGESRNIILYIAEIEKSNKELYQN